MADESVAAVIGAVAADFAIAAADLLAAIVGGSAAMLSESIHATVDGVNNLLLLFALKRSQRPPDAHHPFGFGKELYFWSLIVSCSVFAVGGAASIIEGIQRMMHPEVLTHRIWAYAALGCGALFDASSFTFSWRKFRKQNHGKRFWEAVREAKDPSAMMVIFEDGAAFLGEVLAAGGVFASGLGWHRADGLASVMIGCLLCWTGGYLILQHKDLIVGEGVEDEISQAIKEIAVGEGKFMKIRSARTLHFGPETVLVTMDAIFDPNRKSGELMQAVDRVQAEIRERYPAVKYIYIDPEHEHAERHEPGGPSRSAGFASGEDGSPHSVRAERR